MIQIREFATLTCDTQANQSLDVGVVTPSTFDWLIDLHSSWQTDSKLLVRQNKAFLKIGNYVGYLQSPSGEGIEILPKTEQISPEEPEKLRLLLQDMLSVRRDLNYREGDSASLSRINQPLHEWVVAQFLNHLTGLVKRGLRFDYENVEEESRFIRGQLDMGRQSRQSPARATWFNIRHDVFTPNRVENRLLRTALDYALKLTKNSINWRMANTLSHQLAVIEPISEPLRELPKWQNTKLMRPYQAIKPWCTLILEKLNPNFQHGLHSGISMLFPMEQLFEGYVAYHLQRSVSKEARFKSQASTQHLVTHTARGRMAQQWFQLRPDILVSYGETKSVMDTKWKLLDANQDTTAEKYGIGQADLYQLFAYGHKYQNGHGHMLLIYPKHSCFERPLPQFSFNNDLHLWCVPFDLYRKRIVSGEWEAHFPWLTDQGLVGGA